MIQQEEIWDEIWSIIYEAKINDQDSTLTVEQIKALLYDEGYKLTRIII